MTRTTDERLTEAEARAILTRDDRDVVVGSEYRAVVHLARDLRIERDAARAQVAVLRTALLRYGMHDRGVGYPACAVTQPRPGACSCGLDDVLSGPNRGEEMDRD
ncbi:MAG: hypothetical protein Q8R92_04215 [Deltaproteobacteria bacterium]|nr:hypothetical protein [Deltaproteobacteria bacterium]